MRVHRSDDGNYSLDVPFQDEAWYVVVEEPGHAITQVGPIPIALRSRKTSMSVALTVVR